MNEHLVTHTALSYTNQTSKQRMWIELVAVWVKVKVKN